MHWWDKQLAEYQALPAWKDFPGAVGRRSSRAGGAQAADYPFWLLTARSMQYAWGGNVGMQMIQRGGRQRRRPPRRDHQHAAPRPKLGIADGDAVEIATPKRSVRGRAVLRQGIRPDTLLLIGQFDHWATPLAKDFGVPSLNALATMSMDLTDATGSSADIVRVRSAARASRMTRWAMVADLRRCVGCQTCTAACKHANATPPGVQWRRVLDMEFGEYPDVKRAFVPVGCSTATIRPACTCARRTATKKRADGIVTIDYDLCIGCAYCAVACPYQARYKTERASFAYGEPTDERSPAPRRRRAWPWRPSAPSASSASTPGSNRA